MHLSPSELILNADGSIYHLNLLPEDIATTIITVGDPNRVKMVSALFDTIEIKKGKREFLTHTGHLKGKRISVISTGIGTDNIDIVLNELDALVNIDFTTRKIKKNHIRLDIIRIGTSGAIQENIPVDSFLVSEYAIGFDGLLHWYEDKNVNEVEFETALNNHLNLNSKKAYPYVVHFSKSLGDKFKDNRIRLGVTATNIGFYGPQQRTLRIPTDQKNLTDKMSAFKHNGLGITNLEMETSGIYALSKLLGHRAISLNCILANRVTGEFSHSPEFTIESLIELGLEKICNI